MIPRVDKEKQALLDFLDKQRRSVHSILTGLPEDSLRRAVLPSGWTCLGLVRHLAVDVERYWIRAVTAGEPHTFPSVRDEDSAWRVGADVPLEAVFALYRDEIERSNAIIAASPLDAAPRWREEWWDQWDLAVPDLRWIVLHMIEETARHAGHLDAAREILDGRTGLRG